MNSSWTDQTEKLPNWPPDLLRFRRQQNVLPTSGSCHNKPPHLSRDQNPKPCKTTAGLCRMNGASVRSTNAVNPFVRQERGKRKKKGLYFYLQRSYFLGKWAEPWCRQSPGKCKFGLVYPVPVVVSTAICVNVLAPCSSCLPNLFAHFDAFLTPRKTPIFWHLQVF